MDFKKNFLDHKLFWGFISFFLSILVVLKFVYSPWVNRANLNANIFYSMEPKLKWIVKAQEVYKTKRGTYAIDLKSLLEETHSVEPKKIPLDLAEQVEKLPHFPGMTFATTHSGPKYYFEIKAADGDNYLVQASFMGFASWGEDIWQIDKTGIIVNKVKSRLLQSAKDDALRDRALSWWLLGSLVLVLWGLGEKLYRLINGKSPAKDVPTSSQ